MSTPEDRPAEATVVRSTVVAPSDAGRAALAGVLARLAARRWLDVVVPAGLVFGLEWLLGLPLVVCVLVAIATVGVLVSLQIWQFRRRFAKVFPAGQLLTVSAGPGGFVLTRGDAAPTVEARWPAFTDASLVRGHLVIRMKGSQGVVVLPAAVSDAELVRAVGSGLSESPVGGVGAGEHTGAVADSVGDAMDDAPHDPAIPPDPARVTTALIDDPTISRMARDCTLQSVTRGSTLALVSLLVVLSVALQFARDVSLRVLVPGVTVLLIALVLAGNYLSVRRLLRASPSGQITLTFGHTGFVSTTAVGTSRIRYDELVAVTERGETIMLKGHNGATTIYPRSLFPATLLDEVRSAVTRG